MTKLHLKTGSICPICIETIEGDGIILHKTLRQTHRLCIDCGTEYLKSYIQKAFDNLRINIRKETANIRCPGTYHGLGRNQCEHNIDMRTITIPEILKKSKTYSDIEIIKHILSNTNIYICPSKECSNIVETHPDEQITYTQCRECNNVWCRNCQTSPYHTGITCLEYQANEGKTPNGLYIREKVKNGDMKYCPGCRTVTEKERDVNGQFVACNKMSCTSCGIKWCWCCREMNISYDHFNEESKTKCANMLWKGTYINP